MAAIRGSRAQVGSASWVTEEREFALQVTRSETEEFSFSVRNELDWLNEHMAAIFNENEVNLAKTFKTPGKLRGKTPHSARRQNALEARVPLSDVFGAPSQGIQNSLNHALSAACSVAAKPPPHPMRISPQKTASSQKQTTAIPSVQDSGYFGSQDAAPLEVLRDPRRECPEAMQLDEDPWPAADAAVLRDDVFATVSSHVVDEVLHAEEDLEMVEVPTRDNSPRKHQDGNEELATGSVPLRSQADSAQAMPDSRTAQLGQASEEARSPSDGSSPMGPVVRKSSLNFASLPAREPLTAGKSIGSRVSRTSQLDQVRTSYYSRNTGGKSLGHSGMADRTDAEGSDEMDVDGAATRGAGEQNSIALTHTKTYTQRLQDQINMLGKSQSGSQGQAKLFSAAQPLQLPKATAPTSPLPVRKIAPQNTPGAFPNENDDDEDDWIEPPATVCPASEARPTLPKSHSTDVMEGIQGKDTIGHEEFQAPDPRHSRGAPSKSSGMPAAAAQASLDPELQPLQQTVSGPATSLRTVSGMSTDTPSKVFSSTRDSPLKQVKNKLSSILKSSKGLLASSAAVSAEGKMFTMSPLVRPGLHTTASSESFVSKSLASSQNGQEKVARTVESPARPFARQTRASAEREKEERRLEKEVKRMEVQMDKLDKAREKEREKASVHSREQERVAIMEKQIASSKAEGRNAPKEAPKSTRTSPRKGKPAVDENMEIEDNSETDDALAGAAPPSSSSGRATRLGQTARGKEIKRPVKPTKDAQVKSKQAPTVIRVNTGSQSQYQTSGRLSAASHDTAGPSGQQRLANKSSKASLHAKSSTQGLRPPSSVGRPKTQDLAAKKKEVEDRDAQRRRDAKAEAERKRVATLEEQRKQEQGRRQEAERQRQQDQQYPASQMSASSHMEGKTPAQRRAALEKAKQTKAPPPAPRSQTNGPLAAQDKTASTASSARGEVPSSRPQSRLASNDPSRPVNALLSSTSKAGTKRILGQERNDDQQGKRGGQTYQANEAKRRRTSEVIDDDVEVDHTKNFKGPPLRPSSNFKKDLAPKPTYGYANAPHSATRDLFKATVTAQHFKHTKAAHPLDMAQISKGAIPFAPSANAAGPAHKTPARLGGQNNGAKSTAKSAPRSSPRFQNGESIELPEIQTDDDDDDDDDEAKGMSVAAWADSPDLRRALMLQETMDPSQIFGPPSALNMEEVFHKSKDRWHKFRARTSSANWTGLDRLTEDDVRKDLAARDKLRREGGWSYEMSKEML